MNLTVRDLRAIAKFELNGKPQQPSKFRWTDDEDGIVLSLRSQGFSFKEIARALPGRSPHACNVRHLELIGDAA